jgi:hypothetical protein
MGVPAQQILAQLDAIEQLHDRWSLSNPVRTAIVRRVLEGIIRVPPPRSWPAADKVRFAELPPDIREIIEVRERQRDVALKRKFNELAEQRHNGAEKKPVHTEKEVAL